MKTSELISKICGVGIIIVLLYTIFIAKKEMFILIGALGGCLFLIKLALESTFPKWFENKNENENKKA